MHLFVILGYLLLYFQIRNYYREVIARHVAHLTQQDRDQISMDLRSLIVLFASFSVYAIVIISMPLWNDYVTYLTLVTVEACARLI